MKRSLTLLAGVSVILAVAGCGAAQSSTVSVTPEPTTSATLESLQTASVADYYAIVIKTRKSVDEWVEDWEASSCSSFAMEGELPCSIIALRADPVAGIVASSFRGAQKEGVPAYIGAPPSEIKTVLASTIESAEEAQSSAAGWGSVCPGDKCANRTLLLTTAMEDLQSELDTWEAYLR